MNAINVVAHTSKDLKKLPPGTNSTSSWITRIFEIGSVYNLRVATINVKHSTIKKRTTMII